MSKRGRWDHNETSHRASEAYDGKRDVLLTWETLADERLYDREHKYILELRARVRVAHNRVTYATRNTKIGGSPWPTTKD